MNSNRERCLLGVVLLVTLTCALAGQTGGPLNSGARVEVDVDLVVATATVFNSEGQPLTGLKKEDFTVFEDRVRQDILSFSSEDAPVSTSIVLDVSSSMQGKLSNAMLAAFAFIKECGRDDELALVDFNATPRKSDFTHDKSSIQTRMLTFQPKGKTALYDAVQMGLTQLEEANHAKRALLLISDGEDNSSRRTLLSVKQFVREKDILIYTIGTSSPEIARVDPDIRAGQDVLRNLTELTGGQAFFSIKVADLEDAARKIARELKNQYVFTYRSTNTARDGKWRNIRVTAVDRRGRKLTVHARQGYTAPAS